MDITNNNMQKAYIRKNIAGNILVNQAGHIKCMTEGGFKFTVPNEDIDCDSDTVCLTLHNQDILLHLHDVYDEPMNENANEMVTMNENANEDKNNIEAFAENTFHWSDASTKLFLDLYKNYKDLVVQRKIKTKKIMWQRISEDMKKQGYYVSTVQVENKYKSLERSYKNIKNHNNKTGRNRLFCPYETELTEILGGKHNIEPLLLSGNKGIICRNAEKATTSSCTLQASVNKKNDEININKHAINEAETLQEETSDEITTDASTSCKETPRSKSYTRKGTTARLLDTLKENVEKISNDIREESDNRSILQRQMLEEQQNIRKLYEDFVGKTYEQSIKANKLREDRNNILQELIQISKKNH